MGRILAIDYGQKRTGIAVSDSLQIIAGGLTTVQTSELLNFLIDYMKKEEVERIVVGHPVQTNGEDSENMKRIVPFVNRIKKLYPNIPIDYFDERFTSVLAHRAMIDSGISKKARQNKSLVDKISATIILEEWMMQRKALSERP
ncbi:MAG: Holliday junction resolvase RuvX [Prevotellaceae bacterium]|nr:Holliday junction resolvase RuvX [Candidatus Colivivens equi]